MRTFTYIFLLTFIIILFGFNMKDADAKSIISNSVIRIGEGIRIEAQEDVLGYVVCVGGPIKVIGLIRKSVICIGGTIQVYGKVEGSVVAVGGGIRVNKNAIVMGNVISTGGEILIDENTKVSGDVIKKKYKTYQIKDPIVIFESIIGIFKSFGKIILFSGLFILSFIISKIFKKNTEDISKVFIGNHLLIFCTGLISVLAFLVLYLFLISTIVLIPLVPILVFIQLIIVLSGITAFNVFIENKYRKKFKYLSKFSYLNLFLVVLAWFLLAIINSSISKVLFILISSYFFGAFVYNSLLLNKAKVKYTK